MSGGMANCMSTWVVFEKTSVNKISVFLCKMGIYRLGTLTELENFITYCLSTKQTRRAMMAVMIMTPKMDTAIAITVFLSRPSEATTYTSLSKV